MTTTANDNMQTLDLPTRVDKWLWTVRLFKTRSLATEACRAGKVKLGGDNVKPSRNVRRGDIYEVHVGPLHKTVQVVDSPKNRVGAPLVSDYYTDLTPPAEYERLKTLHACEYRPHGIGRPTKRDRRRLDSLKNRYAEDGGEDFEQ